MWFLLGFHINRDVWKPVTHTRERGVRFIITICSWMCWKWRLQWRMAIFSFELFKWKRIATWKSLPLWRQSQCLWPESNLHRNCIDQSKPPNWWDKALQSSFFFHSPPTTLRQWPNFCWNQRRLNRFPILRRGCIQRLCINYKWVKYWPCCFVGWMDIKWWLDC